MEIFFILGYLFIIGLFYWAWYFIIKKAVKNGILEAKKQESEIEDT